MKPLALVVAGLTLNYVQHKTDNPTICSTLRPWVGPRAMTLGILTAVCWFLPHYARPFYEDCDSNDPARCL